MQIYKCLLDIPFGCSTLKNFSYKNKYLSQEIDSKLKKIKKLKKMEKEMMDRLNNLSQIYR